MRIQEVKGDDDAIDARWFTLERIPQLAFDHDQILQKAIQTLRRQIHFEPIGFELLPEEFTLMELQNLYEAILDVRFDHCDFYDKMNKLGILEQINETVPPTQKNETKLFRFNKAKYEELKNEGFKLII